MEVENILREVGELSDELVTHYMFFYVDNLDIMYEKLIQNGHFNTAKQVLIYDIKHPNRKITDNSYYTR